MKNENTLVMDVIYCEHRKCSTRDIRAEHEYLLIADMMKEAIIGLERASLFFKYIMDKNTQSDMSKDDQRDFKNGIEDMLKPAIEATIELLKL